MRAMAGRLAGKVAIVTGAGSSGPGIGNGKATAVLFAREGARVLCVDLVRERAEETVDLIRGEGGEAIAWQADLTGMAACAATVRAALDAYGRLDVLHNNVGVGDGARLADVTEPSFDRTMAVDVKSMLLMAQAAAPRLIEAGGGSIVNVSSIAGLRATSLTVYAAAKAAVVGLTLSLAGQLGQHRIRANAIAPGYVYTPMVAGNMSPALRERRARAGLIPDEGTAWDVGWAAVFLASDESRWITGQVLAVDGGLTAGLPSPPS